MALFSWLFTSRIADYLASTVIIALLALLLALYAFQTRLIYIPEFPIDSRTTVWRPNKFGFHKYKELTLVAADGTKLHAYWIPHPSASRSVPTLLVFHANAGNMGHRLPLLRRIADSVPTNFLILSYRGYGESEGRPNEKGIRMDAQAALDYLLNELHGLIDASKIIVYGQSVGGAVAIDLVARNQQKIGGLIVENTFTSLQKLIPHVVPIIGWARALCHQKWESDKRLTEIAAASPEDFPEMLFLCGSKDELIPPTHMKELLHIAQSGGHEKQVKMVTLPSGNHNDTCIQPGYFEAIAAFVRSIK